MADPAAHVLLVLPVLRPGGAERIVAQLARRLPDHGFSTSVLCLEDEHAAIGLELMQAGVTVHGLRLSRFRSRACARALAALIPPQRPLILHSHLHHANLATRLALGHLPRHQQEGVRIISTVHIVERRLRPWQFMLDRLTAHRAAAEVCVSAAVMRFQQHRTRLPESFFRVIENGVDLDRFRPVDLPEGKPAASSPAVVSVGRLDKQKDFATLLRAWSIVEHRHPTARLTIAGDGPQRRRLQRLIERLDLQRAALPGFVTDVPALLRSADLYVQSSLWEGQPLAVIEAMATRLPIVVTDGDGLPETISHEKTGLIVPCFDSAALADAMLRLLADAARAGRLAAAAREEARTRFSVDRMIEQYASLYREVTAG